MTETYAETTLTNFSSLTKKPEKFLSKPENLIDNIKGLIKDVYDFTKKEESFKTTDTLPELVVDDFDIEQIWQQIELQNNAILTKSLITVSRLVAAKDRLWFVNLNEEQEESIADEEENVASDEDMQENGLKSEENSEEDEDSKENGLETEENDIEDDENSLDDEEIKEEIDKNPAVLNQNKSSIVDDEFFKLNEMEEFLTKEEKNLEKTPNDNDADNDDEDSVDLFDANSDDLEDDSAEEIEDDDARLNPKYNDFFGIGSDSTVQNNKKRKRNEDFLEETSNENNAGEDTGIKSNLELRDERLKKKIKDIEATALEEKPWQLKGEITAEKRPQNSLLEEVIEFDMTSRPAPVVTGETTLRLEDVIRQRIKDRVWDDVERKIKLVETPAEYKKKLMLDQEKSKQSLAQIYETEYLKQKEALDPDAADKPDEEPKEHLEIKTMLKSLFTKLDALSNFHFTPKAVAPELRIVNNMPAINMEEVAPVAASDAAILAPEEIQKKSKGDIIGKGERTATDRKRERRQKKQKQKLHAKDKQKKEKAIEKMRPGLGNKYSKQKMGKLLDQVTKDRNIDKMDETSKTVKSSTAFFSQLQDEVKGQIKNKVAAQKKKNKPQLSGKKLKM